MDSATIILAIAVIGAVTGFTGLMLGVFNTIRDIQKDRVRLRVFASYAFVSPTFNLHATIVVINLSDFPITLSSVGFRLIDGKGVIQVLQPILNEPLPRRLEPRTEHQHLFPFDSEFVRELSAGNVREVFAHTSCGKELVRRISKNTLKTYFNALSS